jgi:Zn-dependent M28 family amino/carboxypeptidase
LNNDYDQYVGRIKYFLTNPGMKLDMEREERSEVLPTFFVRPEVLDNLVGGKKVREKMIKSIRKKRVPQSKQSKNEASISVKRDENKFVSDNVLCFIEGSDPIIKHEVVVITAHYDHVGIIDGEIYNGADDDGSGTVSVLEIAQAFKKAKDEGHGPRRSVLLMLVSGEEKGLLGSEWYTMHPIFPLESTVVDLNIDMIGRVDPEHTDSNYVYLIGSDKLSTELHDISEKTNATYTNLDLDYTYNDPKDPNRYYYRSDHYNFAKNNIPCIFYFSGVHEDYHKPTDTPDKIMYDKTATIARLVFLTAWDIANRDGKLVVNVQNDFK